MRTNSGGTPQPPSSGRPGGDRAPRRSAARRLVPLALLILGGILFLAFGGADYLSFSGLAHNRARLVALVERSGIWSVLAYVGLYAGLVALSVPGASLMTMAGGFLFGPWLGAAYAVTGATGGAIIVFLAARGGLAGIAGRAGAWARRFEAGFRANGLSYLLLLHLVPLIPFWAVNLAAGALGLRLPIFVAGTFFGIIPLALVYASLGSGLGELLQAGRTPDRDVLFHPAVLVPILGLAALALLPVLYKAWRARQAPP
jgi:uncharacterized membrane protein YdjX (TVP38/TMEM64 family)